MGPLYHLMREQDREKALQEALRVLKPGGLLFASFISTYAPIQDYASGLYDFGDMDRLLAGLEDGTAQPGKNFTSSYFCGEKEAEDMMEKAGLCQLAFAGVENILCGKEELLHKLASQQQEKWLNLAWRLSQDRKLLGAFLEKRLHETVSSGYNGDMRRRTAFPTDGNENTKEFYSV